MHNFAHNHFVGFINRWQSLKKYQQLVFVYMGVGLIFALGIVCGLVIARRPPQMTEVRLNSREYPLIHPLLQCDDLFNPKDDGIQYLRSEIEKKIELAQSEDTASSVSVYFRDLNNGPWFGVNHAEEFVPASLIKLPVLMAYYKLAEQDARILDETIRVEDTYDYASVQNELPVRRLTEGQVLTVRELMERMIVYSDNHADNLLRARLSDELFAEIVGMAGLDMNTLLLSGEPRITAREYASLFRILFNATYLSEKHSNEALQLLTQVTYKQGIVAGVPDDVLVAHKFGERRYMQSGIVQLHDCGIVYASNTPYTLCVLTEGESFDELELLISEISRLVYNSWID